MGSVKLGAPALALPLWQEQTVEIKTAYTRAAGTEPDPGKLQRQRYLNADHFEHEQVVS